jgi:hypothetical protein
MPLKFWDEAFITATYLINRLLSKVIDNQTPLERLLHQKLDYSMLRTFGCACWPNLRPYNTRKLQFRSKRCVFLGYNNIHKGFKCLDVGEGRVYISRDVIFDESVFLFHELHPNVGARLREEVLLLPSADQNSGDECANDSIMIDSSASHKDPTVVFGDQEQNSASTDENSEQMQHYFMQGGTCLACNPKLIWAPDPRLMRLWQRQGILRLSRRRRQQGPPNPTQSLRPSLCLRHLAATPRQHRTCPLLLRHLEPRRRLPGRASRQLPGRGPLNPPRKPVRLDLLRPQHLAATWRLDPLRQAQDLLRLPDHQHQLHVLLQGYNMVFVSLKPIPMVQFATQIQHPFQVNQLV